MQIFSLFFRHASFVFVACQVLLLAPTASVAQEEPVATFSIVGFDPETGEVGVAVQSRVFSVGNGVIWGEADVGVVATQAWVDVSYGPKGIALLKAGLSPQAGGGLPPGPGSRIPSGKGGRRRGASSPSWMPSGNVATYSGPLASDWAGYPDRDEFCSAQGNILAGPAVVEGMVKAFEETEGHLSYRLLAALDAGQAAGGDTRGMQSAAMLIVKKGGGVWLNNDVVLTSPGGRCREPLRGASEAGGHRRPPTRGNAAPLKPEPAHSGAGSG